MFEEQTFEAIMQRMLDRVPNNIDKREGSIIWNALAPAAAELAQMYIELDIIIRLAFANTATGEYLDRRAEEIGIYRKKAIPAKRRGLFYDSNNALMDVPIGSRFRIDDLIFVVTEQISTGEFVLGCETPGTVGNIPTGTMLPIEYIYGLARAELTDIIEYGTEEEDDESLRRRILAKAQLPATSGNANHYKLWALEIAGVGDVKVFPLWNGPGTVKVVIIGSNKQPVSSDIVNAVMEHIEENRPIGAQVTVQSAQPLAINVSATIVRDTNYTLEQVTTNVRNKITEYLKGIAFKQNFVSYAAIGSLMLDNTGVLDYSNLTVNGGTTNIVIGDEQVAVLDEVVLHE